jgi:hypothetical protein
LESHGLWQRALSSEDLAWAIELTAKFYERVGLPHYADAVREFQGRVYKRFRKAVRC